MGILELLLRTYHTYYVSDSLTGFSAFFRESFHVAAAAHLCLFITSYQTSWQSSSLFWVSIVVLHRYTSVPRLFAFLKRELPAVSVSELQKMYRRIWWPSARRFDSFGQSPEHCTMIWYIFQSSVISSGVFPKRWSAFWRLWRWRLYGVVLGCYLHE